MILRALSPSFSLRKVQAHDDPWLLALFRSGRDDLASLQLPAAVLDQLFVQQWQAHHVGRALHFPNAEQWVIERLGSAGGCCAVGAVVVDDDMARAVTRVIDLVVLPGARRSGVARSVLRALQAGAKERRFAVDLTVACSNTAARLLYEALAFRVLSDNGLQLQLRWQAATEVQPASLSASGSGRQGLAFQGRDG